MRRSRNSRSVVLIAFAVVAVLGLSATAAASEAGAKVLIYSGTTGVRHEGGSGAQAQAITPAAIDALSQAIVSAGHEAEWVDCDGVGTAAGQCQHPDANPAVFTADGLAEYRAILLFNATSAPGNPLWTAAQRTAIEEFVQAGGGIAAVHASVDMGNGQQTWPWWDGGAGSAVGTTVSQRTTPGTVANIQVADGHHPSTRHLPDSFELADEHYTFAANVRGNAHVLATRNPNAPASTNQMSGDNPVAWCKPYDGGRIWVTGMGHFEAPFIDNGGDNDLVGHVVGGVRWAAGEGQDGDCGGTIWSNFTRTVIAQTNGPIAIDVAKDGKVYWTEIGIGQGNEVSGNVKVYDPEDEETGVVAVIQTRADHGSSEHGVLGMSLAPDFETSRYMYVYYSPRIPGGVPGNSYVIGEDTGFNVISRFTVTPDGKSFEPGSEQQIMRVPMVKIGGGDGMLCGGPGHVGGASLVFDSDGSLYIGIGDDVDPNCGSSGASGGAPLDQRFPQRYDARNTSANTNDLRGSVLRIKPLPGASGTPGLGQTYTVPAGNLFEPGTPLTRPEIYAMGFRQPFTVHVDPANPGVAVAGEYGPDGNGAGRGPNRPIEWNYIREPGFYGWPYCTGDNSEANSYNRWEHPAGPAGPKFDCLADEIPNESPFNTGLDTIPGPAKQAAFHISGSSPITGPIYRYDPTSQSPSRWPAYFDGSWMLFERTSFIREARLRRDNGDVLRYNPAFTGLGHFGSPTMSNVLPTRFGPDGSLYMATWSSGCCRGAEANVTSVMRIDYTANEITEDDVPPTVTHELTGNMQGTAYINQATLTLAATDNFRGSGVRDIEYSTDGGSSWTEYSDPVSFSVGEHVVLARATDNFENTSVPLPISFTVLEVADHDPPEVEYELTGLRNSLDQFVTRATLSISAADALSGVASIEYRTGSGEWQAYGNGGGGEPIEFTETGWYVVQIRATDTAPVPNTSEPVEVAFAVVPGCVGDYSDEFDGDVIDTTKWDFMHPTTTPGDITIGGGSLTMKTASGEIDGQATGPVNLLGRPLPPGDEWTATVKLTVDYSGGWQMAGLMLYQADNNLIRYSLTNSQGSGATFLELQRDDPPAGDRTGSSTGSSTSNPNSVLMRLARSGENYAASYSWDVDSDNPAWLSVPSPGGGLPVDVDPRRDGDEVRIALLAGGPSQPGPVDVHFDWFRVEVPGQAVDCDPVDVQPPTVSHQVAPADPDGDDGWHRGPVIVTLEADDDQSMPGDLDVEYRIGGPGPFVTYTGPFPLGEDGIHTVEYRATDAAGNASATGSFEVRIDATPPAVQAAIDPPSPDGPGGQWNPGVTLQASASDPTSGLAALEYNPGAGWTTFPVAPAPPPVFDVPGIHAVQVRASDVAGNTVTLPPLQFTVAEPVLDPIEGVGRVAISLPGPDYSGPAIDRTMFRVLRAGTGGAGVPFSQFGGTHVLNLPGRYTLEYFHEYTGGGSSPVFTRTVRVLAPARLTWSVKPRKLKLRKGKTKVLRVAIGSRGGVAAPAGRLCVSAPRKKLKTPAKCARVPSLAPGRNTTIRLRVKARAGLPKGKARANVKLRLRQSGAVPTARRLTVRAR